MRGKQPVIMRRQIRSIVSIVGKQQHNRETRSKQSSGTIGEGRLTIVVVALSWACEKAFLALLRATGGWALAASVPRAAGSQHHRPAPRKEPVRCKSTFFHVWIHARIF